MVPHGDTRIVIPKLAGTPMAVSILVYDRLVVLFVLRVAYWCPYHRTMG